MVEIENFSNSDVNIWRFFSDKDIVSYEDESYVFIFTKHKGKELNVRINKVCLIFIKIYISKYCMCWCLIFGFLMADEPF